jgi:FkbM family methyltransferase
MSSGSALIGSARACQVLVDGPAERSGRPDRELYTRRVASAQGLRGALANVFSPYYVFRPTQLAGRVLGELRGTDEARYELPWGATIHCRSHESVGLGIRRRGLHDLAVSETLLRLTDPGETTIDVGANFGHMTGLLCHAVGASGRVLAFEPHPDVFALLMRNCREWLADGTGGAIEAHQEALSNTDGVAELSTDVFEVNEGSASLAPLTRERYSKNIHEVRLRRLDDVLGVDTRIGVMKMDIEGHELQALEGARDALAAGRIRDVVLEERDEPPTPVTRFLVEHGYAMMRIGLRLRGPSLGHLGDATISPGFGDDQSLLATREPDRAIARLGVRGWAVYGVGPAGRVESTVRPRR